MDQEHEPFLPAKDESQEDRDDDDEESGPIPTLFDFFARLQTWRGAILIHTLLILLYTTISIATIHASRNSNSNSTLLLRPPRKQKHNELQSRVLSHSLTQRQNEKKINNKRRNATDKQTTQHPSTTSISPTHA